MSNTAKKPCLEHLFHCRNSWCPKPGGFTTERGLHIHYMSLHCGAHAVACLAYIKCNNTVCSQPSLSQPWDIAGDDTSVALVAISSVPTPNNTVVEKKDVDKDVSSHKTNQFGITHTAERAKLLNAAAPHFLYQDILAWALEAQRNQYSFCPQRLERSSQVEYLEKWLHLKPCRPETLKLVLPGPTLQAIQVSWFNFTNQLHAILTDPALAGHLDNLDINPTDPFAKYAPPSGRLSTVNSGAINNLAYKNCCKKPNNFLVGTIFACDETNLQKGSKAGSWPLCLLFLFSIKKCAIFLLPGKVWGTFLICP
jgi:hypothetical protein